MKDKDLAYDKYQKMNFYWLKTHVKLLYIGCLIGFVVEVSMMFAIYQIDYLSSSFSYYIYKYVLFPTLVNLMVCFLASYLVNNRKISFKSKQYSMSILTVILTFVFSSVHNSFVSVLILLGFPILITIIYEDEKLTSVVTVLSFVLMFISSCFLEWDPDKVFNSTYLLNTMVIMVSTFLLWVISCSMIHFIEKKSKIIIEDSMEKFDLERRIYIDGLTLIKNKDAFDKEMDEITKDSKNIYHLVMFDIDLFKAFNDDFGHLFGDRVLTSVGKILLENIPGQSAYRYGGDEFCVIFKNYSEYEIEEKLKLVQKQLKTTQIKGISVEITISIGVAMKEGTMTKEEWISKADKALYLSKNSGRNQVTFSQ
ncbi:GGDEF domain-containing protein [Longibaculum muris]|uniref:GGDEF domain-containing protein n=1 Tax=Longibaculum muris TaxID=1796628 RepID=UPI0022E83CBD|nr:GGDEF domain-containing protein [Longibaculum muris]